MDTETRLSVLEARSELIRSLVTSSIGWTLVLTGAVVAAVFAVNAKFDALDSTIDNRFEKFDERLLNLETNVDEVEESVLLILQAIASAED